MDIAAEPEVSLWDLAPLAVLVTEAGGRYLDSAERILEELEEADATAAAERVEVGGTLRVNAPVSFGVRVLAPMLVYVLMAAILDRSGIARDR